MITIVSQNDNISYGIAKYILDSPDDIAMLKSSALAGSIAFIISTGDYYMLTSSKEWLKIQYRKEEF